MASATRCARPVCVRRGCSLVHATAHGCLRCTLRFAANDHVIPSPRHCVFVVDCPTDRLCGNHLTSFPTRVGLDRSQPSLPLKKGSAATMTHDDKRHGTTKLFAALDVKSGVVIGECMPRHRAKEFLSFLRRIDTAVKKTRDIHLVLDNYATHKTPEVQAWLDKHPRFKLHFTPTSAFWMSLLDHFFAEITTKRIRRGSYTSVVDLGDAISYYLAHHNEKSKPFVWSKTAEDILARARRALDAVDAIR